VFIVPLVATAIAQTLAARLAIARIRFALLTMSALPAYDIDVDRVLNAPSRC
jgi:arginyl-tRNA synthetase